MTGLLQMLTNIKFPSQRKWKTLRKQTPPCPGLLGNSPQNQTKTGRGEGRRLYFSLSCCVCVFLNFPTAPGFNIFQNIKHEQTRYTQYVFDRQLGGEDNDSDVKMSTLELQFPHLLAN